MLSGHLSVNNLIIQPGQDSTYNYNYASGRESVRAPSFSEPQVLVTIRGMDEADTVSSSVYVPKATSPGLITNYPDTLSLTRASSYNGLPDTDNTWGNVMIQLYYYSALSRKADSTMPEKISNREYHGS